ncbi:MAG: membrane-bound lytic murein transglycosylase MltC [Thermodesulfobacteriota bacterium]
MPTLKEESFSGKRICFISLITIAIFAGAIIYGCTKRDVIRITKIATTGDVSSAKEMAVEKAVNYAVNPQTLDRDIRQFQQNFALLIKNFRKAVEQVWGKKETREPKPREYVKYTQNYLCRAVVDFDSGLITVETIDQQNPLQSLKNAIITTLLTPDDPRAVDLYSAQTVQLGDTPFLYGEVIDADGEPIRWAWRAERFADHLVEKNLQNRSVHTGQKVENVHFVTLSMLADHHNIRAKKYRQLVENFAGQYNLSKNLLYAIMKTESDFNPYAVSEAPAFGLMQIVPSTAGRDVNIFLNKSGVPSDRFLFEPENNIQYGSVYLFLLSEKYFKEIAHPISRQYCVIAAYNTGAGNVLRTFDRDRSRAPERINSATPLEVYQTLRTQLPSDESRRYIVKVIDAQKSFINF